MSWRETEWQAGLGPEALRNVAALEARAVQARKECQQRQLQLDNATAAVLKARQEGEASRRETQALQREAQTLGDSLQREAVLRGKAEQELQVSRRRRISPTNTQARQRISPANTNTNTARTHTHAQPIKYIYT